MKAWNKNLATLLGNAFYVMDFKVVPRNGEIQYVTRGKNHGLLCTMSVM